MKKENIGYTILSVLIIISFGALFFIPPIEQNPDYHNFSDTLTIFGIPNFWNVISNLPFFFIGLFGLYKLDSMAKEKTPYFIFFLGITLCTFGSAYYHWNPSNETLVWDRLPMTIAFMAMFSIIISEFIDEEKGQKILFPALIIGLLSVLYWVWSGDLRFYGYVQFFPMVASPVIIIFFKSKYNITFGYWFLFLAYIIAKLLEQFDTEVFNTIHIMGGHPLKHFMAGFGVYLLLYSLIKREIIEDIIM